MAKKPGRDGGDKEEEKVVPLRPVAEAGESYVRDMIESGRRKGAAKRAPPKDPPIGQGFPWNGEIIPPGGWQPDLWGLPPGCPVNVLGKDGDIIFLTDSLGQLRPKTADQLGQKTVQDLVGDRQHWLYWAFPGYDRSGKLVRWRNELFIEMVMTAAHRRGLWSAIDKVRGLGMWQDNAGKLIYHAGDAIYRQGQYATPLPPGEIDEHFYPARPPIDPPFADPVPDKINPAPEIFKMLSGWNFERKKIDPFLLLGDIGAAMLGGALLWRPTIFMIGDYGVGKSHLNRLLKEVIGAALRTTKNTTAPAIYRLARNDSLPIAVDELEASASDNRRAVAVVELARQAADGGKLYRTGADGQAQEFTVHGSFFFSAINQPPLGPQDFSRMIILYMRRLSAEQQAQPAPVLRNPYIGPMLVRRLMDEWPRFQATFDAYREVLRQGGHSGRGQDTFGTALACADLLLGPAALAQFGFPVDDLRPWADWLAAAKVPELQDADDNWFACLRHLITARVDAWREGHRKTVGKVLDDLQFGQGDDALELKFARNWLYQAGLGIVDRRAQNQGYLLAIPHTGQGVADLFRNQVWAGQGAAGGWVSALRGGPPEVVMADPGNNKNWNVVKINGFPSRCVLVSLDGLRKHMEGK